MSAATADRPEAAGGKQYHLGIGRGDMGPSVLLPGDPERVPQLAAAWDVAENVANHREYRSMRGTFRGRPVSACSTGIGGPSTEIALNELAATGSDTFLRLGTTGGLQKRIRCGEVIISTAAIRWDGASDAYAPPAYPASASFEVVIALIEASERLKLSYHVGVSASTGSFYAGQSRPAYGGFEGCERQRLESLQEMGVLNFEMEAATIFTLSSLFGLRSGAACVVVADRFRNEFKPGLAAEVLGPLGAETLSVLSEMDALKGQAGKDWYFPGLIPSR